MSRQEAQETVRTPDQIISDALDEFALAMRRYDKLKIEEGQLREQRLEAMEPLENLDIDLPFAAHVPELAYDALAVHILDRKMEILEKELRPLNSYESTGISLLYGHGLMGSKVKIASLNPEKYDIGAFTDDGLGNMTHIGPIRPSRNGKIKRIMLSPEYGGWIHITSRGGMVYQAAPLIDRENDYQPAFSINVL